MRATTLAAGGLACAGAAMTIAAFAGGGRAEPSPSPAPPRGLQVWVANGCGGCHTLTKAGSDGTIGPNLTLALRGESRDFIMRSIVTPGAEVAPNYGDLMPRGYARRNGPDDLRALVDFLAQ